MIVVVMLPVVWQSKVEGGTGSSDPVLLLASDNVLYDGRKNHCRAAVKSLKLL